MFRLGLSRVSSAPRRLLVSNATTTASSLHASYTFRLASTSIGGDNIGNSGITSSSSKNNNNDDSNASANSIQTGSVNLVTNPQDMMSDIEAMVASFRANNPNETVILTFNAIRRMHMHETKHDNRKQLEAQAWRTIQKLSEKDIDGCSDLGVAIVVSAWSYFSRHWENGRRGPSAASSSPNAESSTAESSSTSHEHTALNALYPVEKDFEVKIDHSSALIHELDFLTFDGEKESEVEEGATDELGGVGAAGDAKDDIGGSETDMTTDDAMDLESGSSGRINKSHQRPHPSFLKQQQYPDGNRNRSNSNVDSGNSQNQSASGRKILRRKSSPAQSEIVEAPRSEVLDEVFE